MKETTSEILQGTLDLMVLKTLEGLGPLHGYGIARRIEQVSEGVLELNQGTIYPALRKLEDEELVASEWDERAPRKLPPLNHCRAIFTC